MSVRWDPDMIAALRMMRAAELPMTTCAKRIGVAISVARKKAHELGIGERIRNGPPPGSSLNRVRAGLAGWERRKAKSGGQDERAG